MQRNDAAETVTLDLVDEFFGGVFEALEAWQPVLAETLAPAIRAGGLTGAGLAALIEQDAHRVITSAWVPIYGAGFCATAEVIGSGNPLAWWQGPERQPLLSSAIVGEQYAVDYRRLEWFRVPERSGQPHVAGPYVDYLCSNEITLTSALPLVIDGAFVGVACADVLVSSLEATLLPAMERMESCATLVNAGGRVIVSSNPDYATGDPYRGVTPGQSLDALTEAVGERAGAVVLRSDRFPLAVIIERP